MRPGSSPRSRSPMITGYSCSALTVTVTIYLIHSSRFGQDNLGDLVDGEFVRRDGEVGGLQIQGLTLLDKLQPLLAGTADEQWAIAGEPNTGGGRREADGGEHDPMREQRREADEMHDRHA